MTTLLIFQNTYISMSGFIFNLAQRCCLCRKHLWKFWSGQLSQLQWRFSKHFDGMNVCHFKANFMLKRAGRHWETNLVDKGGVPFQQQIFCHKLQGQTKIPHFFNDFVGTARSLDPSPLWTVYTTKNTRVLHSFCHILQTELHNIHVLSFLMSHKIPS